ncbi:ATP:cob(I)alamin adenosyltransferase, partial [Rhizobium ruizarguesonis]
MVKLNKIYTKTGDDGTTGLVSGPRRLKDDLRIEAYGTIDEANSAIGLARLYTAGLPELDAMLMSIQNDLFDLGADLATPDTGEPPAYEPLRIIETQVDRVEHDIDQLN